MHDYDHCARVIRVMDARAHARVPVFQKAHARMKRTCETESIRKIAGQRRRWVAERARWLTLTRIPGSVWPIFSNREKPIQSVDVPLLVWCAVWE